jgi:O-antigen ligase
MTEGVVLRVRHIAVWLLTLALLLVPAGRLSVLNIAGRTPDLFFVDLPLLAAGACCGLGVPFVRQLARARWGPLLVLVVVAFLGVVFTPDTLAYMGSLRPIVYAFAVVTIVTRGVQTPAQVRLLLYAIVIGVILIAVVLYQVVGIEGLTAFGDKQEVELDWGRSNYFGTFGVLAIFAGYGLVTSSNGVAPLLFGLGGVSSGLLVLLESKSRGAMLAVALVASVGGPLIWARRRPGRAWWRWPLRLALAVAGGFGVFAALPYVLDLIGSDPDNFMDTGNLRRIDAWLSAIDAFASNPVFGVGWSNTTVMFEQLTDTATTTHSLPLQLLAETGLVGFTAFSLLAVRALRPSGPSPRVALDRRLRNGMRLAVIGVLAHCSVEPSFWGTSFVPMIWTLIALLHCTTEQPLAVAASSPSEVRRPMSLVTPSVASAADLEHHSGA